MLRKLLSLGAVIVVAVVFGVGTAAAAHKPPADGAPAISSVTGLDGFSDGRLLGFSDGRFAR